MEIAVGHVSVGDEFIVALAHSMRTGVEIARSPRLRRPMEHGHSAAQALERALDGRMTRRGYFRIGDGTWVRHVATAEALGVMQGLEMGGEREPEPNQTVLEADMRSVALVEAMAEVLDNCRPDLLCSLLSSFALDGGDEAREDPLSLVHDERALEVYLERHPLIVGMDRDRLEALWALQTSLTEAMEEIAPDGCVYGTLEGDGACFGFWEVSDDDNDL
jgi:hypothetical protein